MIYQQPSPDGPLRQIRRQLCSETLTHALANCAEAYAKYQNDPEFMAEFNYELAHFVGRPRPCTTPSA